MQKIELGSIFVDYEDTTPKKSVSEDTKSVLEDSKSLSSETESEFEETKSESEILESKLERHKEKQNPLKNFNAWLLIKYSVQFFIIAVFAENVKDVADESMLSVMIFLFALASYPILIFTKYQKFSLKIAEFQAQIAENQASEKVGEELIKQKTIYYKNAFLEIQDLNKTLASEVKRLGEIEERFLKVEKELLQTKQERTAFLNADKDSRQKLEKSLEEFRSLEAEINQLVHLLDKECVENERLSQEKERLLEQTKTLSEQNETLSQEKERLLEQTKTLSEQNENFENLIKEFSAYQKTLVNGVAALGVGGALDKNFVKSYLLILEKCKGGSK